MLTVITVLLLAVTVVLCSAIAVFLAWVGWPFEKLRELCMHAADSVVSRRVR
jgi:hypothetical protein